MPQSKYSAIRNKPEKSPYQKGDVLVLFGELFNRGYANGLVEAAEKIGMKIIYATVGRREKDGRLRPLNEEELALAPKPLINIPLEAGFDMEPTENGVSPVDQLKEIKLPTWTEAKLDFKAIEASRLQGRARFKANVQAYMKELSKHIQPGQNVLFAHLMAGGVPRAKIIMPLMNRVFKGQGERHLESELFWKSDLGKLNEISFSEVTAETFRDLIELSGPLRKMIEASQGHVSYTAYGYHGTEVLINGQYQWQTYTPYLQGWAKMQLEEIAREYWSQGIHCCVYNCPEILTNSSSIFQGVEVCLYPLLQAMQKESAASSRTAQVVSQCKALLKPETNLEQLFERTHQYLNNPVIRDFQNFAQWPRHSQKEQMEIMLQVSDALVEMHADPKKLITAVLSEVVFEACGEVMLHDSWNPSAAVNWINHDLVARQLKAE